MPDTPDERKPQSQPRDWLASPADDFSWDDDDAAQQRRGGLFARRQASESTPPPDPTPPPDDSLVEITLPAEAEAPLGVQFIATSDSIATSTEIASAVSDTLATPTTTFANDIDAPAEAQFIAPSDSVTPSDSIAPSTDIAPPSSIDQPRRRVRLMDVERTDEMDENGVKPTVVVTTPPPAAATVRRYGPLTLDGWLLIALILIAAYLRFNGLMYDNNGSGEPQLNHPDERFIAGVTLRPQWPAGTDLKALLDPDNSPISTRAQGDPWHDFSYGSLPIYMTRIAADIAEKVSGKTWAAYPQIVMVGRFLSGVVDIGTMLLVFLIGRRLYNARAGLFAAAIICFSVLHIQLAHFFATDSFVTFFFMLTIYFALKYMQDGRWSSAALMGLGLGFAIASKFTIAPLALVIFVAFALRAIYVQRPNLLGAAFARMTVRPFAADASEGPWSAFARALPKLFLSIIVSLLAFEIGEPYALFRLDRYFRIIGEQNNIMKGLADVPYTRQYIGTMPVIYQLGNLTLWGLGIVMGSVVMAGLFFMFFRFLFDIVGLGSLAQDEGRRFRRMRGGGRGNYLLTRILGAAVIIAIPAVLVNMYRPLLVQAGVLNDSSTGLLSNSFVLGGAVGVGAILFFALFAKLRFTRPGEALLFSAALPYAFLIFSLEAKWARYMLPLVPIFALLTAGALWTLFDLARRNLAAREQPLLRNGWVNALRVVGAIAIVGGVLWSAAFEVGVYGSPTTFSQTTKWVQKNIAPDAYVGSEGWDEGIPGVGRPDQTHNITFNIYDTDRPGNVAFQALDAWMNGGDDPMGQGKNYPQGADYIVIASNRLYMTVPKLPWRYAVASRYYDLLFSGKLGYEKIFEATRYPSLFGFTINDDNADETFTVYDHPKVMIFHKVRTLSQDDLKTLFGNTLTIPQNGGRVNKLNVNSPAPGDKPITADKSILIDPPPNQQPVVQDYAWNSFANANQWIAIIIWLAVMYLLSFIALPLTWGLFRWLPDRGYAFSKVLALVLIAFFAWLLSSLHISMFDVWGVLIATLLTALLGGYFWVRQRHEFITWLREHAKLVLTVEVIFLAIFAFQLWLRTFNPDLWGPAYGGERPMEFAFLNGVLRSPYMPPEDPTFYGGSINYYYYGYVILAVLIKLTGITPTLAFNLSMALIYALAFSAIASVVYNTIVFAIHRNRNRQTNVNYPAFSGVAVRYGVLGGVLAMMFSNIFGGIQAMFTVAPDLYNRLSDMLVNMGVDRGRLMEGIQHNFNFWTTSRIIPGTITEFPFWSFLYGDLHPHLISIPVQVMCLGFALNFAFDKGMTARWLSVPTNRVTWQDRIANFFARAGAQWSDSFWPGMLRFFAIAVSAGSLAVINSWDFPTALIVIFGGLLIPLLIRERANGRLIALISKPSVWLSTILLFGAVVGAALVAYLPFYINFKVLYSKLVLIVPGQPVVPGGDFKFQRTELSEYLVIWGLFVFITVGYLLLRSRGVRLLPESETLPALRPSVVTNFVAPGFGGNGSRNGSDGSNDDNQSDYANELEPATEAGRMPYTPTAVQPTEVRSRVRVRSSATHEVLAEGAPIATIPATNGESEAAHSNGSSDLATLPELNGELATNTDDVSDDVVAILPQAVMGDEPLGEQFIAPIEPEPTQQSAFSTQPSVPVTGVGLSVALPGVLPLLLILATAIGSALLYVRTYAAGPQYNDRILGFLTLLLGFALLITFGRRNDRAALATSLFLLVPLGITTGTELIYLADHLQGGDLFRMNTIFKFYEQAWIYFAIAGAMALYYIYDGRDEAVLPPLEETAATAAVIGDDPNKLITTPDPVAASRYLSDDADEGRDEEVKTAPTALVADEAPTDVPISTFSSNGHTADILEPLPAAEVGEGEILPYTNHASSDNADTPEPLPAAEVGERETAPNTNRDAGYVGESTPADNLTTLNPAAYGAEPIPAGDVGEREILPNDNLTTLNPIAYGTEPRPISAIDEAEILPVTNPATDDNADTPEPLPAAEVGEGEISTYTNAAIDEEDEPKPRITNDYAPDNDGGEPIDDEPRRNDDAQTSEDSEPNNTPASALTYDEARAREEMAEQGEFIEQPEDAVVADDTPLQYLMPDAEPDPHAWAQYITPNADAAYTDNDLITDTPITDPLLAKEDAAQQQAQLADTSADALIRPATPPPPANPKTSLAFRVIFTPIFIILVIMSMGFNVFGTKDRLEQRFNVNPPLGTLDGIDWMTTASLGYKSGTITFKYEHDAIEWLLANVQGMPTVVQAPENYYREAGDFVATFTGFPTILSPQHAGEQRYGWQVEEHNRDADNFFKEETDIAATQVLMSKYNVEYIYLGQVERIKYELPAGQPNKFEDMVTAGQLEKAYSNEKVTIYHVKGKAVTQAGTELKAGPRPSPTPRPTATPYPPGFDTKMDALRKKVADAPEDPAAHSELAQYLRDKGDADGAVAEYKEVVRIQPDNVGAWQSMGDVLASAGRNDEAIEAWKQGTDAVPNSPDMWNKLAIAYRDLRQDYAAATDAFNHAIQANGSFGEAYFGLAATLERNGDTDGEKRTLQDCVNKSDNPDWKQRCQERLNALP